MSTFMSSADYQPQIRYYNLQDLLDDNMVLLDWAEETAIQLVKDHIYQFYDVDVIFAQTGANRHRTILQMCVDIVLYQIHQRLADVMIPDLVRENYKTTLEMLKSIAAGDVGLNGAPEVVDGSGNPVTIFDWGSYPKRSH